MCNKTVKPATRIRLWLALQSAMEPTTHEKMSVDHKPFRIQEAVSETGREVEQRKQIIKVFATANEPGAFQNLQLKKRQHCRVDKVIDSMVTIVCEKEEILPFGKEHNLIYYIDDTEGAKAEHPRIRDYYWVPATVSSLKVLDDTEHRERGFLLYSKEGELICYKLSGVQQSMLTKKDWWEEHSYAMLKEAFDTQPNNPQGTQKIGQFIRYIMYGWHQEQLTRLVVEYVTRKLTEKEKTDQEKKAANDAKVGEVKVSMKKFMAQMEKLGLIAVAEEDITSEEGCSQG
jgi:hypothetical protein